MSLLQKFLDKNAAVHFLGCGGVGTAPLMRIFHQKGFRVSGSDLKENHETLALKQLGLPVFIGEHNAANLPDAEQLLLEYGFMQEVEKRAQEVISGMITAMGYKGYDILFHGKGKRLQLTESTATDTIPQQPFPQSEDEQMETVE